MPQSRVKRTTVNATPVARKLASEHGVDLNDRGRHRAGGRIREQDVLAAIQSAAHNGARGGAGAARAGPLAGDVTRERMSPLRQRIASRLVEAQQTAAMLTTFNEVDMTAVMELRKQYKEPSPRSTAWGSGSCRFFVKACVRGLGPSR